MTVDTSEPREVELEAVVADTGDLVVPSSAVREWALVPGQRVPLKGAPPQRRPRPNVRGILAGKVRPLTREEMKEVSREVWGEWAK